MSNQLEDFKWGVKMGVGRVNKGITFYESCTFGGNEYSLYDSVYVYHTGDCNTSIGKIVKLWELPGKEKKVKLVWFYRPAEIRKFLGDYEPQWNELFLGSGVGMGLCNVNSLGVIAGKCNIICTSNDRRNLQPSNQDLVAADFIFSLTFNVAELAIYEKFPDEIGGVKVDHYFNKKTDLIRQCSPLRESTNAENVWDDERHCSNDGSSLSHDNGRSEDCLAGRKGDVRPPKKRKIFPDKTEAEISDHKTLRSRGSEEAVISDEKEKEVKISDQKANKTVRTSGVKCSSQLGEDRSSWFKPVPWEEKLGSADAEGRVVLLENLDPDFTSTEVKNFVFRAFNEKADARMLQNTPVSSRLSGRALVLFATKDAAKKALHKLTTMSLMLGGDRIVVGSKPDLTKPGKESRFPGHLDLKNIIRKPREEKRNAVSTAHCSQPNTLQYDMAMDWRLLQEKSEMCWDALHGLQKNELQLITSKLRIRENV